jgi:hypothetical protein
MYESLFNDRLQNLTTPQFSKDEYGGVNKKYKFKCNKCSSEFLDSLDDGNIPLCPLCFPKSQSQKFEFEIYKYIKEIYNNSVILHDKTILNKLELDIYIPDKKIAIECNGNYFHSEISGCKTKKYHLNKTELCEKQGIQLIHIFEDEWVFKRSIVESRIKKLIINEKNKIYARNCIIKEISYNEKSNFLNEYHIQGNDVSQYYIGCFYKNELISVMTFSRCRFIKDNQIELTRFCSSKNVIGSFGKLLKYFIKNYKPKKIISYADRRFSIGNVYETLNFKKIGNTPPNYFYIFRKSYLKRMHRFNFKKSSLHKKLSLYNKNISEWDNMKLNGYDRIWDCGSIKYELNIND